VSTAAEIVVEGQVQGVGFRQFAQRRASLLGVAGYVMNLTVTMKAARENGDGKNNARTRSALTMRYTASIPMNYGTPAVPPTVGPQWSLLASKGSGRPQAEALPVTMALEWGEQIDAHLDTGGCEGIEQFRSDTTTLVKGKAAATGPITQSATQGYAQALMQISGLLTSYSFVGGVTSSNQADVVTTSRRVDHCAGDRVTNETKNTRKPVGDLGNLGVNIKDVPLPPTPPGLRGTRNVPLQFNGYSGPPPSNGTSHPYPPANELELKGGRLFPSPWGMAALRFRRSPRV